LVVERNHEVPKVTPLWALRLFVSHRRGIWNMFKILWWILRESYMARKT